MILLVLYVAITARMMQVRCRSYYSRDNGALKQCLKCIVWPVELTDKAILKLARHLEGR